MDKYTFTAYFLVFFLGADVIYIIFMPFIIIPFILTGIIFTLMLVVMNSMLSEKCSTAANKQMIEKYGPIIMKYMEDPRKECVECGTELEVNARYCNKCGKKIK